MIATVTLNPALDRIIILDEIENFGNNKINHTEYDIGGKGTHVSAVLSDFGVSNVATGILGGHNGKILASILKKRNVDCQFIVKENYETRTSYIIIEKNKGNYFMITERGNTVDEQSKRELFSRILKLSNECEFIVFSGGVCPGFETNIYKELIEMANKKGVKAFLDASGMYLKEGLKAIPYMIKPNIDEFSEIIGHKPDSINEIIYFSKKLIENGIGIVAVSMDKDGSLIISRDESFRIYPPKVKAINTVGCGDIFFGCAIYKLYQESSLKESFKFATAFSATKAEKLKTSEYDKKRALMYLDQVVIEDI